MARTPSTMLELGTAAPGFALPEPLTGKTRSLEDYADKPLLVVFMCNHCPYVIHIRDALVAFANDYQSRGLNVVAISANDVSTHPDDSPEKMAEEARQHGYPFAYLYDDSQEVAKSYQAACTPDFFMFDKDHKLYYRGQFDDARPRNDEPVTGKDLRNAAERLLAAEEAPQEQKASLGCNIKWKAGNEPAYFG